jgi:hypothetical protein
MERLGVQEGIEVGRIKKLMQEWYDEDPTLNEEELIQKYYEEIGNNRFAL